MSKFKGRGAKKKTDEALKALAQAYRCGHCQSTAKVKGDRLMIGHDNSCPALNGAVSRAGDTVRAIEASGLEKIAVLDIAENPVR